MEVRARGEVGRSCEESKVKVKRGALVSVASNCVARRPTGVMVENEYYHAAAGRVTGGAIIHVVADYRENGR